jgi:hypothetical protein
LFQVAGRTQVRYSATPPVDAILECQRFNGKEELRMSPHAIQAIAAAAAAAVLGVIVYRRKQKNA